VPVSCGLPLGVEGGVVVVLELGGWDVAAAGVQAPLLYQSTHPMVANSMSAMDW
jgi:hypothetical protein